MHKGNCHTEMLHWNVTLKCYTEILPRSVGGGDAGMSSSTEDKTLEEMGASWQDPLVDTVISTEEIEGLEMGSSGAGSRILGSNSYTIWGGGKLVSRVVSSAVPDIVLDSKPNHRWWPADNFLKVHILKTKTGNYLSRVVCDVFVHWDR